MKYRIHGYITVPFEVVVDADDQDEAEEVVHAMGFDDLIDDQADPDGERTVERVELAAQKASKATQVIERSDALTALWRFKDGGDIHYVFACNEADAREVFLTETGVEDLTGWELTHLTVDQADAIPVKDEDDHGEIPTTLGAIYRSNPERGYVCGTQ